METRHAIVDFDCVLFDKRMFIDLVRCPFILSGVDGKKYDALYKKFREILLAKNRTYNQDEFVAFLKKNIPSFKDEVFRKMFAEMFIPHFGNMVYEDSRPFLGFLRKIGCKITIVSHGNERWQTNKIKWCGLYSLVDDVVITEDTSKVSVVDGILDFRKETFMPIEAIFVDDNYTGSVGAVKKAFSLVKVFHVLRPEFVGKRYMEPCDHICSNLAEVMMILDKKSG